VTGGGGRRCKQLLDDLKEKRRCRKLKEEALDRTLWRPRFGRFYGPVVRQTTESIWIMHGPLLLPGMESRLLNHKDRTLNAIKIELFWLPVDTSGINLTSFIVAMWSQPARPNIQHRTPQETVAVLMLVVASGGSLLDLGSTTEGLSKAFRSLRRETWR
jgi:hypothetical protein